VRELFDEEFIRGMNSEEFSSKPVFHHQTHQGETVGRWFGATFATKGCRFGALQKRLPDKL